MIRNPIIADILDLLRIDGGTRTIGQLLQEREAAAQEIERLRRRRLVRQKPILVPPATLVIEDRPTPRFLKLAEVCSMSGLSRSSIYRWIEEGKFPEPMKIGYRAVRWRSADIFHWQDNVGAKQ